MPKKWLQHYVMPQWLRDSAPDQAHPHRRRFTSVYRRKRSIVKNVWIISGAVMIIEASPALIAGLLLGTTFLSFMILDETG